MSLEAVGSMTYTAIKEKNEKLEKGLFLKTIAISENASIYDAYKMLDKNNYSSR